MSRDLRTWQNGRSLLTVEREPGGGIRFNLDDIENPGYGVMFDAATRQEIAAFIKEGQ
jgi:hypothetical protein